MFQLCSHKVSIYVSCVVFPLVLIEPACCAETGLTSSSGSRPASLDSRLRSGLAQVPAPAAAPAVPGPSDSKASVIDSAFAKNEFQAPLAARITLNLQDIPDQEPLKQFKSPLILDALRQRDLDLDQVLKIAVRRNLPYLQQRWLGRSANLQVLGGLAALNGFNLSENAQDVRVLTPPPTLATQTAQLVASYRNGTAPPAQQSLIQIERLRYRTYGFTIANGGQTLTALLVNYFQSRVQAATVRTSLQTALFNAANSYFSLCKEIALLHVADISVENSRKILSLNEALWQTGMGTKLQLLQAKTQLAQDRQSLVSQQVQTRASAINLGVTLNLPLSDYIMPMAVPLDKTTLVDPKLSVEQLVALAMKQRPEIPEKRNAVRQQLAQSLQTLTPLVPTSSYQVQEGKFFPSDGAGTTDGTQRTLQFAWQLNALGAPVGANFAAGLSSPRAAQMALYNQELQIRSQVRQAYIGSAAAERNIEIARQAEAESEEQLKLAEERLSAGIGINIDVIQAQSNLTRALQNYVNAVYNYNIQQAQLRQAIGGFTVRSINTRLRYD